MKAGGGLLICETKSLGAAYRLIQEINAASQETVEVIPTADGAVLMVSGGVDSLVNLLSKATDLLSNRIVENLSNQVIESFLGLQNPPLGESLVIFESRQAGDVFEAALRMEAQGLRPFDLRILRGGTARAYVMATGSKGLVPPLDGLSGQLTAIDDPGPALKNFFEPIP